MDVPELPLNADHDPMMEYPIRRPFVDVAATISNRPKESTELSDPAVYGQPLVVEGNLEARSTKPGRGTSERGTVEISPAQMWGRRANINAPPTMDSNPTMLIIRPAGSDACVVTNPTTRSITPTLHHGARGESVPPPGPFDGMTSELRVFLM